MKSGFVCIIGKPNVGKSTLINRIVGEKIAITSPRPQTTRTRIIGVVTDENSQIVFVDTPGIHAPRNKLAEAMVKSARDAGDDSDVTLLLVDQIECDEDLNGDIIAINKIDTMKKEDILPIMARFAEQSSRIFPISAKTGDGVGELLSAIREMLPEGPKYFPDDTLTNQPERVIVSEIIREKCLFLLQDEVPFGIAVEIESMKSQDALLSVEAVIYCEKQSHKGMIIGKNGAMLKEIGTRARREIERIFGEKVFLKLWVKVSENWRNNDRALKNFGYREG